MEPLTAESWAKVYNRHLKPGGYVEQVEIDLQPRCDDGSLEANSIYRLWYHRYLSDATNRHSRPIEYNPQTPHLLSARGFTEIAEKSIKLPIGEWSRDQIDLGRWYRLGIVESVEPLSLAAFTRPAFNWHVDDARRLIKDVRDVLLRADIHAYNVL